MFLRNLQFQPSADPSTFQMVIGRQVACMRLTANTLEFLTFNENSSTKVSVLHGTGLGILRRLVIHGAVHAFRVGRVEPKWAGIQIDKITAQLAWTKAKEQISPDPNSVPPSLIQFQTTTSLDLWSLQSLSGFAVSRANPNEVLFQFQNRHSYICTCLSGRRSSVVAGIRSSNLEPGCLNHYALLCASDDLPPGSCTRRVEFPFIEYKERDLLNASTWDVMMDYRDSIGAVGMHQQLGL